MNDGYIAVLDSGIGGISLLIELIKVLPNERYLYLGDNKNAPYGNKSVRELMNITEKNIDFIKQYNIKALALGCNTLSVLLLDKIKAYADLPVFGVFPPVEKAMCENELVMLLATTGTAKKYENIQTVKAVGLPNLAREIEKNAFCLEKVDFAKEMKGVCNEKMLFQTLILGCTHYNFLKNKIIDHLKPQKVLNGEYFTAKMIKKFIKSNKSLENNKGFSVLFIGENADFNRKFFEKSGQQLLNFDKKIKKVVKKFQKGLTVVKICDRITM